MSFGILVDSVSDVTLEEGEQYGIKVIPLTVEVDGEYFKDQVEISTEEFYDRAEASETLPKSSQPSPAEFINVFNTFADEGCDQVIAVHIASALSGTPEGSRLAAAEVDIPVEVIDSKNVTSSQAILAFQAARMRDSGATAEEVVDYLNKAVKYTTFYIAPDTLENLLKNGRLSESEVETATLLNIKPLLSLDEDGILRAVDKAKGMNGVIKKYVEIIKGLTDEYGTLHIRFHHSRNEKDVEKLKKQLAEAGVDYIDCGTAACGATLTTHAGLGSLGFGALPDVLPE